MTDDEIIARVRKGETRLFEELVLRYQDAVYGTVVRMLGRGPDAEDASQEIFLRVYRSLDRFQGAARFSTWLYRVAYNHCIDRLRARRPAASRPPSLDAAAEVADQRVDIARDLEDAEDSKRVRAAVDALDPRYRGVVVLLYYQRLSYEEIARIMSVPVKTVETRLYRARKLLRRALERSERGGAP